MLLFVFFFLQITGCELYSRDIYSIADQRSFISDTVQDFHVGKNLSGHQILFPQKKVRSIYIRVLYVTAFEFKTFFSPGPACSFFFVCLFFEHKL